jgi:5-methylcytosine-specific restriction endonuclease McrA
MQERICRGCPSVIIPGPRERHRREWCSEACRQRWWRANHPEAYDAIVRRGLAKQAAQRAEARPDCLNCGERVKMANARYCSKPDCTKVAKAAAMRERYARDPEAARRRVAAYRDAMTPEQVKREKSTRRAWAKRNGYVESKRAGDARRRARARAAETEKFTHREIFDRDGWRCGICDKKIRKGLPSRHPRSASLDHVVPLSLGGSHTRANVRAAHLDCNITRGAARKGADQLALL